MAYLYSLATWKKIAIAEKADLYVVELACLLHDIADYKLHEGDEEQVQDWQKSGYKD